MKNNSFKVCAGGLTLNIAGENMSDATINFLNMLEKYPDDGFSISDGYGNFSCLCVRSYYEGLGMKTDHEIIAHLIKEETNFMNNYRY